MADDGREGREPLGLEIVAATRFVEATDQFLDIAREAGAGASAAIHAALFGMSVSVRGLVAVFGGGEPMRALAIQCLDTYSKQDFSSRPQDGPEGGKL